jgi:triphosphoribosyl-dephospho-CoA synthase
MTALASPHWLRRVLRGAFVADVRWLKPGNVSRESPGHGMTAADFERSAGPAADALVAAPDGVGERILAGVQATREVVACNTNLGILLLAAPLVQAALERQGQGSLRARLDRVLEGLTQADAEAAFEAIRLAAPGGLGRSPEHDVSEPPACTLREAMAAAAPRDLIARQFVTGFAAVLDTGFGTLETGIARYRARGPALADLQLTFLSRFPDSHVQRKHGQGVAEALQVRAAAVLHKVRTVPHGHYRNQLLGEFDRELKEEGINPGTSADLTVATLIACRLVHAGKGSPPAKPRKHPPTEQEAGPCSRLISTES